jgi:transaldolase
VELVKNPVSVEVTEEEYRGMVEEAKIYSSWDEKIVIKIPMGIEGLKAVTQLEKCEGVKTNVTAIMATNQAILSALSGASYASIFYGRVSDMGYDPVQVIRETSALYKELNIRTKLIVGSIRTILDVNKAFLAGADIVTVPFPILRKMTQNPKTEETVKEFNSIWREMKEKGLIKLEEETPSRKLTLAKVLKV